MSPGEKSLLLRVVAMRVESSRFSNLRYSCVSFHKLNGVTFTPGPVWSTGAEGGFKFSLCYPEHLCSHLNWFLTSINSAGNAASICFNFQAPPAPHKWAFMEYLKILIFCALLANYRLRAFYSAIVCGAFMCREGTEPPVGQTDTDGVRKAVWLGRGATGIVAGVLGGYWSCRDLIRRGWDLPMVGAASFSKHGGASKLSLALSTVQRPVPVAAQPSAVTCQGAEALESIRFEVAG